MTKDLNQSDPSADGEGINANEISLSGICDDCGVFKESETNKSGPCVDGVGIIQINQTDGEVMIASEINQSVLCEDSEAIIANVINHMDTCLDVEVIIANKMKQSGFNNEGGLLKSKEIKMSSSYNDAINGNKVNVLSKMNSISDKIKVFIRYL